MKMVMDFNDEEACILDILADDCGKSIEDFCSDEILKVVDERINMDDAEEFFWQRLIS